MSFNDPLTNRAILSASVDINSSGSNSIVTAVAGKKIYLLSAVLVADADSLKITFQSDSTDLSGEMNLGKAGNGFVLSMSGLPYFSTNTGEALKINLSSGIQLGGFIQYYVE